MVCNGRQGNDALNPFQENHMKARQSLLVALLTAALGLTSAFSASAQNTAAAADTTVRVADNDRFDDWGLLGLLGLAGLLGLKRKEDYTTRAR